MSNVIKGSIPNNVKKMIQNLKEIYVNHTDDEIYAMLKECSMDPNETAQKLLHQDTFHEVKRRRDRKSEQSNREIVESRRPGPPGRGSRGGRGYHSSHFSAQGVVDGRNTAFRKENGFSNASYKGSSTSSAPVAEEGKKKDKHSSITDVANGPSDVLSEGTKHANTSNVLPEIATNKPEFSSRPQSRSGGIKRSTLMAGAKGPSSDVCSSALDPVLVPTSDTRVPAVGAIKREVGIQRLPVEPTEISVDHNSNASKTGGKSQGASKNQATEVLQSSSLNHGSGSSSRPSSNYGSRSQHGLGSLKVGPNKEWKPKPTSTNTIQAPKALSTSEGSNILLETSSQSKPIEKTIDSEEATNKLHKQLESLRVRDAQHVIIPSHIHVPDSVRTGLSFGSFDATFVISPKNSTELENENSKTVSLVHLDKELKDDLVEQPNSQDTLTPPEEVEYADCSSIHGQPESSSLDIDSVPSTSVPDLNDSKETASASQNSNVHVSPSYSFDVMPPMLGNQLGQMDGSETQARDVSRVHGFPVQPADPSSFYTQFHRPASDNDGRVSPFANHGVTSKYTMLSSQTSQSLSEGGNTMVLPTPSPPLGTQASGVISSSIAVTQHQLPIFRHPSGIHMPHYPPNLIPYAHYFSPFYVPPPAMHQFLGNNPFHQPAQPGNLYPPQPQPSVATSAVKFPLSQYKPGNNAGNSAHMAGVGGGYGPYGVPPAGFNPGPPGNTTSEDLAASQFKDNVYLTGQQTEGPAVWFPGPGRNITSLPANAFYNLPPHGQHVTYGPTQPGHGPTYPSIFHPAQAVTAAAVHHPLLQQSQPMPGVVGPQSGTIYQQPQHSPMNWPNNY